MSPEKDNLETKISDANNLSVIRLLLDASVARINEYDKLTEAEKKTILQGTAEFAELKEMSKELKEILSVMKS